MFGSLFNTQTFFARNYYDCLDDAQKDGESKSAFDARVESQRTYLSKIGSLPGVHLRTGTVMGRQRRQKEVDVLLAVDMLTHGSNGSMGQAVLLAGDLDFRPVVDALVRTGVYVVVWYEKTAAPKICTSLQIRGYRSTGTLYIFGVQTPSSQPIHSLNVLRR